MPTDTPAILGGPPIRPEAPPDWPFRNPAVEERLRAPLADGSWGKYHGPHIAELTKLLAEAHQAEHVLLCSSGTAAVEIALRGIPVGPGDEVILAAYDFKGNFQDVLAVGATPVLVDVRPDNWNLDAAQLTAAIGEKTKAIIVSHLHGGVVDMPEVMHVSRERRIAVIEDAAQMPGATIHGKIAGTSGDVGVLSFGGSKLVSAGRGGAVFTSRADIAQRIRLYTQRGNEAYPLSELQAAAVIPQWEQLPANNERRSAAVTWLTGEMAKWRNGETGSSASESSHFAISPFRPFASCSASRPGYYKWGLQYDSAGFAGLTRDQFAAAARAEGIALDPGFRSLHLTHSARRFRAAGDLPVATLADAGVLTLHHPVLLGTPDDLSQILKAIHKVQTHAAAIARLPESAFARHRVAF